MQCANCGLERTGSFCAHCGQNDRDYQRALPPLLGEVLSETFEVDSRLARTLKLLLLQPGELSLEFSRNRRARYLPPFRLYLFISIGFFFLLSVGTEVEPLPEDQVKVQAEIDRVGGSDPSTLIERLTEPQQARAREILARPEGSIARLILLGIAQSIQEDGDGAPSTAVTYLFGQLVNALYEPASAVRQFMDNLAIGMLVMLPIYAALLKLFYLGKRRYYVETLVFSSHLHSFTFLVFSAQLLVALRSGIGWLDGVLDLTGSLLTLWLGAYHYLALKRYFGEGWLRTLVKFVALLLVYAALLLPTAFVLVLAVTLLSV